MNVEGPSSQTLQETRNDFEALGEKIHNMPLDPQQTTPVGKLTQEGCRMALQEVDAGTTNARPPEIHSGYF